MKYSELLNTARACPFCNLSKKEIITENENAFLTFSIAPYHPDHLLICTKRHIEHILDITDQELQDINSLQKEGLRILKNLGYKNFSFLLREGMNSGKTISHLHYHIIPEVTITAPDYGNINRMVLGNTEIEALILRLKSVQ